MNLKGISEPKVSMVYSYSVETTNNFTSFRGKTCEKGYHIYGMTRQIKSKYYYNFFIYKYGSLDFSKTDSIKLTRKEYAVENAIS